MLPFSKPRYVKASKQTIQNSFVICAVGLASDTVMGTIIDNKVALEQIHPTYSLALLPLTDNIKIRFEDALFYADCFAYEHEIPVIPELKGSKMEIEFLIERTGRKDTRSWYSRLLVEALENVVALRLGPLGYVEFRYDTSRFRSLSESPILCLDYSGKYRPARQEVHLYSLALRQIDPLSEYLCYYRVIESASKSNGLSWLEQNLGRLEATRFGMLPTGEGVRMYQRRTNLFTILRRRAVTRLRDLAKNESYADIACRLYRTNRCGIAHGQRIRWSDFTTDIKEIFRDSFVLKLMARLAVDDELRSDSV
jgi:hypothetical protein